MRTLKIPDDVLCETLLDEYGTPEQVRRHCYAVAEKARCLAEGRAVNMELLLAAALLHDIARTKKDHASVGADFLKEHGFADVGDIIAVHHELPMQEEFRISEKSLLFLADKLVLEDRECTLEERFLNSMKKIRSPEGLRKLEKRFRQAGKILNLLERERGLQEV